MPQSETETQPRGPKAKPAAPSARAAEAGGAQDDALVDALIDPLIDQGGPGGSSGGGRPLPRGIAAQMEGSFGTDLSDVRVHTNSGAAEAMNAEAFTQGTDVHFAPGRFSPQSGAGKELIGHELSHVVQQSSGQAQQGPHPKGGGPLTSPALESEADRAGKAAARGQSAGISAGPTLQAPSQAPVQRRGALTLLHAQNVVATKRANILQGVQATTAGFTTLRQGWPARVVTEGLKPAVATWTALEGQLNVACAAAPSTDRDTLGDNVRNIVQLGERITAAAQPALAAIQPALTALAGAGNDPALADLVLLLGETCGGVQLGVAQAGPLGQLLQAAGGGSRALVTRACTLTQNNAANAARAAIYLAGYVADPKADAVSERVLTEAAFDVDAAKLRMTSLKVWGYDISLETWAGTESDTLAQGDVDKIKLDAQQEKQRLQAALPADPGSKPVRAKKEKKHEHESRVSAWQQKVTARAVGLPAIQGEQDKIDGADAKKAGLKKDRHDAMTTFMTTWTPTLGVELAGWTLKLAGGKEPVAVALAGLQTSPAVSTVDKKDIATWAISVTAVPAGIADLRSTIEAVVGAGCSPAVARPIATWQLTAKASATQLGKVAAAVAASPGEVQEILTFVQTKLPFDAAVDALHRAVVVGKVTVQALDAFCGTHGVEDASWALTKGKGDLVDGQKLLDMLGDTVNKGHVVKLLQKGTTDDIITIFKRVDYADPNPERLLKLYGKADSAQIKTLVAAPDGFDGAKLETLLVTKGHAAADLVTLRGLTTAVKIESMLNNSGATATQLLAAYNQINGGGGGIDDLKTQIEAFPGKSLPILVGAWLSRGSWDRGSFGSAMESIFYHHNKHGAGQTVEQYTQDAQNCWAGGGAFDWTDSEGRTSKKIQGPPGGTFTSAGQIYSFWYA